MRKKGIVHGTSSGYTNYRCRCDHCRQAHRVVSRRWAQTNRERVNASVRAWYKTEKGILKNRADAGRYRALKKRVRVGSLKDIKEYSAILQKDPCSYCGATMQHRDHIVPLSKDGIDSWDNLTAACQSCNDKKSAKSLLQFLLERE